MPLFLASSLLLNSISIIIKYSPSSSFRKHLLTNEYLMSQFHSNWIMHTLLQLILSHHCENRAPLFSGIYPCYQKAGSLTSIPWLRDMPFPSRCLTHCFSTLNYPQDVPGLGFFIYSAHDTFAS